MFKLVIQDDEGKTTVVPLIRDEITIGRKEGNTIRLTERNVSRRHARIVRSHRGADGGYQLARPSRDVSVAEVVVAMEGSVTSVQGTYPDQLVYPGPAGSLAELWRAVDAALTRLLEEVSVADLASGTLPVVAAESPMAGVLDTAGPGDGAALSGA